MPSRRTLEILRKYGLTTAPLIGAATGHQSGRLDQADADQQSDAPPTGQKVGLAASRTILRHHVFPIAILLGLCSGCPSMAAYRIPCSVRRSDSGTLLQLMFLPSCHTDRLPCSRSPIKRGSLA
jgi:hypothetical protein